MIYSIVEIIKNTILGSYIEKKGGIVYPMVEDMMGENNEVIEKVFPVIRQDGKTTCNTSDYIDYVPNDKLKSILYFELNSNRVTETTNFSKHFTSNVTLVFWVNLKRTNKLYTVVNYLKEILKQIPLELNPFADIYNVQIDIGEVKIRDKSIFNKYTYKEQLMQYLIYPFDFGSIDIEVQYSLNNCLAEITESTTDC